ncbi:TRAP transporter substrate-binding protein [Salibacterium salarium]|uniref:TRAP transporter substrate-binding protein n=2 Tax=Salibacterium salarium TaxID=284579 RepID=A0A3R9PL15_9BACI|nr:TRAP transporter substrate-binding protein [Salibacterium salarium]
MLFFTFLLVLVATSLMACSEDTSSGESGESSSSNESSEESSEDSGETQEFAFSHLFPNNHVMEQDVVQVFASEVEEATGGEIAVNSYPGAQLAAPDGQYEAAATGVADMGFSVHSYNPGQFPLTSVMELPFMGETGTAGSQVLWDLYEEFPEIQEEYSDTVPLWLSTSEAGQIFTVDEQVKSVEDLEGMKIRSPSPEVNAWLEEMGATPVSMSMNEVYEALEKGVVDGTVGPIHTLLDYSLQEVIDYVTVGDFYMTTFFGVMNQQSYDSMSAENQELIDEIRGEHMSEVAGKAIDARSEEAVQAAKSAGAEFYELSDEELAEWEEKMQPTIDSWIEDKESSGLPGQEVYDKAVELSTE